MSHKKPFFSVVIPTYNRPDLLAKALRSVKGQTFTNFECIVIDDGSKDSDLVMQEVESLNDDRFSYVYQSNGGACKARNRGIDLAEGSFVALLDSDDVFLDCKLEAFYELLKGHLDNDNLFCYSQLIVDRGENKRWIKPKRGMNSNESMDEYLLCTHGWAQTSTQVLSANLAKKLRFDESLPSSQDSDFAIRCWRSGAVVKFIEQPFVVMNDIYDPSRVSKQTDYASLLKWLDNNRRNKMLSEKAYWGYRGWEVARIASYSNRLKGVLFYVRSLVHFPYSFKMSILVFAQIVIPQNIYQKLATTVVKYFGKNA